MSIAKANMHDTSMDDLLWDHQQIVHRTDMFMVRINTCGHAFALTEDATRNIYTALININTFLLESDL